MKPRVYSPFKSEGRRSFRILHEDHGADRGNDPAHKTLEGAIRRVAILSPIIGVHDEAASALCPLVPADRLAQRAWFEGKSRIRGHR
jgi:hypothetical protein